MKLHRETSVYLNNEYQASVNAGACAETEEHMIARVRQHMLRAYDVAWHMENDLRPANQRLVDPWVRR